MKLPGIKIIETPKPCARCNCGLGFIDTKGGQDCVRCLDCAKYTGWNAPKTATGREIRTIKSTHKDIQGRLRSTVLFRSHGRCEICGKGNIDGTLQVGHILSVKDGHMQGLGDDLINSEDNVIAECAECNSGHRESSIPIWLVLALLRARRQSKKVVG